MDAFSIQAPTRIDFGGGWTDVPPYDAEQGGFVCNVAISRYATVTASALVDPAAPAEIAVEGPGDERLLNAVVHKFKPLGVRLSLANDFPVAAGLGGSSAASVAAISAVARWMDLQKSRAEIAEASRELEVLEMGIAGGRQDHYAAAFGGALGLTFRKWVGVEPIALSPETIEELPRRCLVIYTGESRISATTITAVMGAYRDEAPAVRSALLNMRELAKLMVPALGSGNIDELGRLVGEQWVHQRSLHPAIPTPLIDKMIETAMGSGAIGCKALGASGGGCVLMIAAADRVEQVRAAVAPLGTEILYAIDTDGVSATAAPAP